MEAKATEQPELVGSTKIAERLGVSPQRVNGWAQRPDFPAPAYSLPTGRVWDWAKIESWAREHRP